MEGCPAYARMRDRIRSAKIDHNKRPWEQTCSLVIWYCVRWLDLVNSIQFLVRHGGVCLSVTERRCV